MTIRSIGNMLGSGVRLFDVLLPQLPPELCQRQHGQKGRKRQQDKQQLWVRPSYLPQREKRLANPTPAEDFWKITDGFLCTGWIKKTGISGILADFGNLFIPNVMATSIIENITILQIFGFFEGPRKKNSRFYRDRKLFCR